MDLEFLAYLYLAFIDSMQQIYALFFGTECKSYEMAFCHQQWFCCFLSYNISILGLIMINDTLL